MLTAYQREQITALCKQIQKPSGSRADGPGISKIPEDEGIATEVLRRDPSLKPIGMQWSEFMREIRVILREQGLFTGPGDPKNGQDAALSIDARGNRVMPESRRQELVAQQLRHAGHAIARPAIDAALSLASRALPAGELRRRAVVNGQLRHGGLAPAFAGVGFSLEGGPTEPALTDANGEPDNELSSLLTRGQKARKAIADNADRAMAKLIDDALATARAAKMTGEPNAGFVAILKSLVEQCEQQCEENGYTIDDEEDIEAPAV